MHKLTLRDLNLQGKRVLMRVDFNVPISEEAVSDDTRIKFALPSIKYVLDQGASLILMSHLGRPKGVRLEEFSLAPVAAHLCDLLGISVMLAPDCVGEDVEKYAQELKPGEVMLLENLRFHLGEEKPDSDPAFTRSLAKLGDVYVNDAFAAAHRKHSSTYFLAKEFPGKAACGFLVEKEMQFLKALLTDPKRPFFAIIGGAKIGSKIGVLTSLSKKVDGFFIGGGMAYTFFKVQGIPIGDSICDEESLSVAKNFLHTCKKRNISLHLPEDIVIASHFDKDAERKIIQTSHGIPDGWQGLDIGPKTIETWNLLLKDISTVFWNGPMGVFEFPRFATGTNSIAQTLSSLPMTTIVGGGDSVAAINQLKLAELFTHISTGGGASLEFIEQGHLPGIDVLTDG